MRYRRAMILLASAGGNTVPVIARLLAADEDTVRDVTDFGSSGWTSAKSLTGLEWWPYPGVCEICGWGGLTAAGRRRRETVRLQAAELFERKVKPSEVARQLRVSRKSAYQWHQLWRDGGVQALASCGGSRCRLSPRCLQKLAAYLEQGPAAHGWVEDQVWTASRVATLIGRKFHVTHGSCGRMGADEFRAAIASVWSRR